MGLSAQLHPMNEVGTSLLQPGRGRVPHHGAWRLSLVVAVLMAAQSATGVLAPFLYRDTEEWVLAAWFGNDLVTLLFAVPLLVWSLLAARKGAKRAELVWYSLLGYSVYNYAFYLFGAALNWFLPVYALLFTLPIVALILGLGSLDAKEVARRSTTRTPVRWIGGYMLFTGAGLLTVWTMHWLRFMLTGATLDVGEGGMRLIAAMDLTFMVPLFLIGAVTLLVRKPWGFVLAPIVIMKGATYTLVLTASSSVAASRGIEGALEQLPLWAGWTVAGFLALWGLFSAMERSTNEVPLHRIPPAEKREREVVH